MFLRFANFYRHFIQGFRKIAAQFNLMLKTTSNELSPEAIDDSSFLTLETKLAFFRLIQVFTKAPIFYFFDSERYICIETDASCYAIGDIFS